MLIETILTATTPGQLELYFFATGSGADASPLYFHPSRRQTTAAEPLSLETLNAGLHWSNELKVGDATWRFVAAPIPGGPGMASHVGSWLVLAGCFLITLVVSAYVWSSR
ncbi:MAG TPA: hypothetical protein VGI93_11765, partial [Steroidobacteraceae bacterium]